MIHFTCDLCGKKMLAEAKDRFVVMIEIRPSRNSWELTEEDLDDNNLEKVSQIIQQAMNCSEDIIEEPVRMRYDLCSSCRERFLKNPFNCQVMPKFDFSEN